MSHVELEILIRLGKAGVSMTHEIQIRELIWIHLCRGNRAIVRFFFPKFVLHYKRQFENSTSLTRRVTGKTGEISFAHCTING